MRFFTNALLLVWFISSPALTAQESSQAQLAHFHHVRLNVTDPAAAIDFCTSKFDCEKATFAGLADAVWAQKSWLLFTRVDAPPKSEITSTIWHIGWGAEDMKIAARSSPRRSPTSATLAAHGSRRALLRYVDGPEHQVIELNTANHHHFGHIHNTYVEQGPPLPRANGTSKSSGFRGAAGARLRASLSFTGVIRLGHPMSTISGSA